MNNDQVCHAWAHQTRETAKNGNGSLWFDGAVIYSYGRHFPIARIVDGVGYLFTTADYSVTTTQHKTRVRRAIPYSGSIFLVADVLARKPEEHAANFADYCERIQESLEKAARARKHASLYLDAAETLEEQANQYARAFNLGSRADYLASMDLSAIRQQIAERKAIERQKAEQRRAAMRPEFEADLASWKRGEIGTYQVRHRNAFPTSLRYVSESDIIETTQHATVPAEHARRVWHILKHLHDNGKTYKRNGHSIHLGHYIIESLDSNGVLTVGCHKIEWSELESIAAAIGAPSVVQETA